MHNMTGILHSLANTLIDAGLAGEARQARECAFASDLQAEKIGALSAELALAKLQLARAQRTVDELYAEEREELANALERRPEINRLLSGQQWNPIGGGE